MSVSRKIIAALHARLCAIDGSGDYIHSIDPARILRRTPSYDLAAECSQPVIFISRRAGGESRDGVPPQPILTTVVYDVIGVVPASDDLGAHPGDAAEDLLADIERALERPDDLELTDAETSRNLLDQELTLAAAEFDPPEDAATVEVVGVGVNCRYPHTYGDPNHVT